MANSNAFQTALEQTYVNVLRGVLAEHPSATTAELRELVSSYPQLGNVTLTQLFGAAAARPREARPGTLRGAVLAALRELGGSDIAAGELRSLGATPDQLRKTLNGLISEGIVTYTGQTRGTRYSLV